MSRSRRVLLVSVPLALALAVTSTSGASRHPKRHVHVLRSNATLVAIPRGQPVQIALAAAFDAPGFEPSIANAVEMAVEAHPAIRGFPIHVNVVSAPCGDAAGDVAAATRITSNLQNVGVLGQFCSSGFDQALPIYQRAGLVTISGSATNDDLPSFAPAVFNRTVVDDDTFDSWYAAVSQLPSDLAWQQAFRVEFGAAPSAFADLYYDAASLLIRDLQRVSTVDRGDRLIVNRAALAQAVRNTTRFQGVSCTITLDPATGNRLDDPAALSRCAA
jgi:ABC-type branched-subunit amino acid transport system substrate-binding protein